MNYRHAYHVGNHGDVLKHIILTLLIDYLKRKSKPFRVLDIHAGCGIYSLHSKASGKTGEWRHGIGHLMEARNHFSVEINDILGPYFNVIDSVNRDHSELCVYPGSPVICHSLLRENDKLIANELQGEDYQILKQYFRRYESVKTLNMDAWQAVKALLPPIERRGLILIDPPFEDPDERKKIEQAIVEARNRFKTGLYALWYPIKERSETQRFVDRIASLVDVEMLRIELLVHRAYDGVRLNGSGMLIINPPFVLKKQMACLLPVLSSCLAQDKKGSYVLESLK